MTAAKDIFDKGYNYGFAKVDMKTTTSQGIQMTAKGNSDIETNVLDGSLESSIDVKDYGLTFSEKWDANNKLTTSLSVKDPVVDGSNLKASFSYKHESGEKSGLLGFGYKQDFINTTFDAKVDLAAPIIEASAVVAYDCCLAGCQLAFNVAERVFVKNNFALGCTQDNLRAVVAVNDMSKLSASFFKNIQDDLSIGVQATYDQSDGQTRLGLASQYLCDSNTTLGSKINNAGQIGFSVKYKLASGVDLTVSSLLEALKLNEGGHKFGVGVGFEI